MRGRQGRRQRVACAAGVYNRLLAEAPPARNRRSRSLASEQDAGGASADARAGHLSTTQRVPLFEPCNPTGGGTLDLMTHDELRQGRWPQD
jgi:hypothetical protein